MFTFSDFLKNSGKSFHKNGAQTLKARQPYEKSCVQAIRMYKILTDSWLIERKMKYVPLQNLNVFSSVKLWYSHIIGIP